MSPRPLLALLLYALAFLAASVSIARWVNDAVPAPYMDEEFHVGQTQAYCAGRWSEWHPKITTFPGLYLTAVPYARAMEVAGGLVGDKAVPVAPAALHNATSSAAAQATAACSVAVLRSINILYGVLCLPLYFALLRTLHPAYFASRPGRLLLAVVQLSLFPLSFFFMFLYYTDGASVFWTLAAYLAHLRGHRFAGALLGVCAVAVRQTNVAWIGFFLLTDIAHAWSQGDARIFGEQHARRAAAGAALVAQNAAATLSTNDEKEGKIARESVRCFHPPTWGAVPSSIVYLVLDCLRALPALVVRHWATLLTCAAFVAFVIRNGGSVVVGDAANHVFTPHFPQMLYFIAFATGFTVINWIGPTALKNAVRTARAHWALSGLLLSAMFFAVHLFTMAHPFLLADNRHYPFYIWKNLFRRWSWFKYAVIPVYALGFAVMQRAWSGPRASSKIFQTLYWMVTGMCLIPTPLLEPRYFLTPFILWFIHAAPSLVSCSVRCVGSIALYAVVNAATLLVFVRKPFAWNDGSMARFMW